MAGKRKTSAVKPAETKPESPAPARCGVVYIGPSIPKTKLQHGVIFAGTLDEAIGFYAEELRRCPTAKRLLIPKADLAEVRGAAWADRAEKQILAEIAGKNKE